MSSVPKAELVFANPPCSRYSNSAGQAFDYRDRDDLSKFIDLQEVAEVGHRAGARIVWWETGPLCWNLGRGMVEAMHKELNAVASCIVRIDTRYIGVPQRRPRCHIFHVLDEWWPSGATLPQKQWPPRMSAYEWIYKRLDDQDMTEIIPRTAYPDAKACFEADRLRLTSKFQQGAPMIYDERDPWVLAVLSGRCAAWAGQDRWMTVEDNAALMGVPLVTVREVAEKIGPRESLTLMSKGVCADVAAWVLEHLILGQGGEWVDWGTGLWELDLGVKDSSPRRRYDAA